MLLLYISILLLHASAVNIKSLSELSKFNEDRLIVKTAAGDYMTAMYLEPGSYSFSINNHPMTINSNMLSSYSLMRNRLRINNDPKVQGILVNQVWTFTKDSKLQFTYAQDAKNFNVFLGGADKHTSETWMHVKFETREEEAQALVVWEDVKGKVYFQAKDSNFWLTYSATDDILVWEDRITALTAFDIVRLEFMDKLRPVI